MAARCRARSAVQGGQPSPRSGLKAPLRSTSPPVHAGGVFFEHRGGTAWQSEGPQIRRPRRSRRREAKYQPHLCPGKSCNCRKIASLRCNNSRMIWTDLSIGFVGCIAITLAAYVVRERRQRSAFIASLSPAQREGLRGFETVKGDWRAFRDLSPRPVRRDPSSARTSL